ncbi:MAG TPA: aspartate--tRNA ligase [Gemmatimonadaceae bacterium]|nr:aspartate--tRNA ligase [Gemmatimonadaceae bacterium]
MNSQTTGLRTHMCGVLRATHAGNRVKLGGWVHRTRNLGGLVFLDLRDRSGLVQVSFDPNRTPADVVTAASGLANESVVLVEGEVVQRPEQMRNADMATGDVEVVASGLRVVGPAETPAIPVARAKGEKLPAEELRLRHRYLDLRRQELQQNLILRHVLLQATRKYLSDSGFLELETPILTKPTPEGARDYLVPSRVHPGEFYALPQSPQIYKQLFMVSGFDRYFQIARCFRDEDLRADRQPEFTQIDIEGSFVTREDIASLSEEMIRAIWSAAGKTVDTPFPRMTHREAMERYGSDRPDTRYGLEIVDATRIFGTSEFSIAKNAIAAGGRVRGIVVPNGGVMSRKQVDEIEEEAKSAGAGGLIRLKRTDKGLEGGAAKFLADNAADSLGIPEGALALFVAGPEHVTNPALDRVRQLLAARLHLVPEGRHDFLWVVDFPMFEKDPKTGALGAVHHPFTAPHPDDIALLTSSPEKARALAYDVVMDGMELGGGSIRISDPSLQSQVFSLLGIDEETARARFGFLLEGLRSGAPPHGGIAFGFDRITMVLAGATSLRDVIAFPKTTAARALFEGAPTAIESDDQLRELHIRVDTHTTQEGGAR